jgi:hypothetical protein
LLVCLLMAPPSQELEPPANPERFNLKKTRRGAGTADGDLRGAARHQHFAGQEVEAMPLTC